MSDDPTVPLWEIALPVFTNDGRDYGDAHMTWQAKALHIAGGYSQRPVGHGAWRDPKSGEVYVDHMMPYRVACSPEAFGALVDEALRCFPDQVAIYTARLGEATIVDRHEWDTMCAAMAVNGMVVKL